MGSREETGKDGGGEREGRGKVLSSVVFVHLFMPLPVFVARRVRPRVGLHCP